jgi:hypothetical protein
MEKNKLIILFIFFVILLLSNTLTFYLVKRTSSNKISDLNNDIADLKSSLDDWTQLSNNQTNHINALYKYRENIEEQNSLNMELAVNALNGDYTIEVIDEKLSEINLLQAKNTNIETEVIKYRDKYDELIKNSKFIQ